MERWQDEPGDWRQAGSEILTVSAEFYPDSKFRTRWKTAKEF